MNVKNLKQNWRKYVFVHEIVQYYKMYVQCTLTIILSNCALNAEWKQKKSSIQLKIKFNSLPGKKKGLLRIPRNIRQSCWKGS